MNVIIVFIIPIVFAIQAIESADLGVCYGALGCFNITSDFQHILYRPINLLPENPENFNTIVLLYSRAKSEKGQIVPRKWLNTNVNGDKLNGFDGDKQIQFIVSGFLDNPKRSSWQKRTKKQLLINGDYNVFIVDWSDANKLPYSQAAANSRVIAAQLSLFIKNLKINHGTKYKSVHLIGHSLGAHLVGYVGQELSKTSDTLGRITGLDPAQPSFQYMPETVRLDRSDADFVDVIHTDSKSILQLGLGMSQAIGHIDFYPNGGTDQPGCSIEKRSIGCNHRRAIELFIESINTKCNFTAFACDSWTRFSTEKKCSSCGKNKGLCARMGYYAVDWKKFKSNTKSKKFYLNTNSDVPFCGLQYKIEIKVESVANNSDDASGRIDAKLNFGSRYQLISTNAHNITNGMSFYSTLSSGSKEFFDSLSSIELKWFRDAFDVFDPNTWNFDPFSRPGFSIADPKLFIKQINVKPLSLESGSKTKRFCNHSNSGLTQEKSIKFKSC